MAARGRWLALGALGLCAGAALASPGAVERVLRDWGFSEGMRRLDTGAGAPGPWRTSADCGPCHQEAYRGWRASRHAAAFSNEVFQAGFSREPVLRCVNCHAPRREQVREVAAALPRGPLVERRAALEQAPLRLLPGARAHDGVDCLACHVREGVVWTREGSGQAHHQQHPAAQSLGESAFCAGCHQFRFHHLQSGRLALDGLLTQRTFDEWRAYRQAGGEGSCQGCHMKGGSHEVKGTRHVDFMRGALGAEVEAGAITLWPVGVGHHFPTGDLFRHLTVESRTPGGAWERLAWLGRRYASRTPEGGGPARMALVEDTGLRPFERRRVALPEGAARVRVLYHYVPEDEAARGRLGPQDLSLRLFEAAVPE